MASYVIELEKLELESGSHIKRDEGVCVMEAVAWLAGEEHSDAPKCVCPVLRSYGIEFNDGAPDEQRQLLKRSIPGLIRHGTSDAAMQLKRAFFLAEKACTVFAAAAMRAAGLVEHADSLQLVRVFDADSAYAASNAALAAHNAALAASNAALAARNAALAAHNAALAASNAALAARNAALAARNAALAANYAADAAHNAADAAHNAALAANYAADAANYAADATSNAADAASCAALAASYETAIDVYLQCIDMGKDGAAVA